MKVLPANQQLAPFFGSRMSFIGGLDPLGLQNSSTKTYSMLLPGLNNVTGRVRYYSFYSWLLDQYASRNGSTDPKVLQHYVRKAEYIVALCSQFTGSEINSIPGSLYAGNRINENPNSFDLEKGIYNSDGSTDNTYWKYELGAMGQYYLGSLMDIGVIARKELNSNLYGRTSTKEGGVGGEDLALSFELNLSEESKKQFFRLMDSEKATAEELKRLLPDFNLMSIPSPSEEISLLRDLFFSKDYPLTLQENPTSFRKHTIDLVLRYALDHQMTFDGRDFTFYAYAQKGKVNSEIDDCLLGWYYYQLNEFWQYGCTSILNGFLDLLQTNHGIQFVPLSSFLDEATSVIYRGILEEFSLEDTSVELEPMLEVAGKFSPIELYHRQEKLSGHKKASYGFMMIWSLFENDAENLENLTSYVFPDLGINNEFNVLNYISRLPSKAHENIEKHIRNFLLTHIIYRQQVVAYRKMGGGSKSTQKFIIEQNQIRYIDNFDPSFTGPRLDNLLSFLMDLELLDQNKHITEKGMSLLTSNEWD